MVGVRVEGVLRCPYCHEGCSPRDSVACLECLGRHHDLCWVELGACAACGHRQRMIPESKGLWGRTDQELFELIRLGQRQEVESYLLRCQTYAEETRARTSDVATCVAFDELAQKLAEIRRHHVVGVTRPEPGGALQRLVRAVESLARSLVLGPVC